MCWNAPISLATWVTSVIGAIMLIKRGDPDDIWNALFVLTFSSVQLWEFFMWIDQSCKGLNQFATKMTLLTLWCQPLMQCVGWLYASEEKSYKNYILIPIVVYSLFMLISLLFTILGKNKNWCSKPKKCYSLNWSFAGENNPKPIPDSVNPLQLNFAWVIYMLGLFIPLLFQKSLPRKITLITVNGISLILLFLFVKKCKTISTYWCSISNIYVWLAYFIK